MATSPLQRWLERRADEWRELDDLLTRQRGKRDADPERVDRVIAGYRAIARDLALARQALPGSGITRYLESLFTRAHDAIHRPPGGLWHELVTLIRHRLPADIRALGRPIAASLTIFLLAGLAGGWLVWSFPELAVLFASEKMIAEVEAGKLWTDDLLNVVPSSLLSLGIMTNNIVVTLTAFGLGAFYGLGTLYILGLNGLMLGGVFAFTAHHGLAGRLFEFIVAHGLVELSVIVLAGAAGIRLGEALIRPGNRSRGEAFGEAARRGGGIVLAGALLLVGAGLIEGYISPDHRFDLPLRVSIGVAYWILFLLLITGRLWRIGGGRSPAIG